MKNLDELTTEELGALQPGEALAIRFFRTSEFRVYQADGATVLGQLPGQITVSVYRTEARDLVTTGVVRSVDGGSSAQIVVEGINARAANVEEAQLRMAPQTAVELAVSLLTNTAPLFADLIAQRLREQEVLRTVLWPDV